MATSDDHARVTRDAVNVLGAVLDTDVLDDEETWRAVDEFRNGDDLFAATEEAIRAGRPIPRCALIVCLSAMVHQATAFGQLIVALRLPEEPAPRFADSSPGGVEAAELAALQGLATLELLAADDLDDNEEDVLGLGADTDDADEGYEVVLTSFVELGRALADTERYGEASRAILVAVNFDKLVDGRLGSLAVAAHRLGLQWAIAGGEPEYVALHLAGVARGLAQQSTSPDSEVPVAEAAEAWWFAIRNGSALADHRDPFRAELALAADALPSNESVKALLHLLSYDAATDSNAERKELFGQVAMFMQPEWDLDQTQLLRTMPVVGQVAMALETMIIGLDPVALSGQLETSWTTQMFEHPSYRRTVAHGRTLYREG